MLELIDFLTAFILGGTVGLMLGVALALIALNVDLMHKKNKS